MPTVVVTETISTHYIDASGNTYSVEVSYGPEAGIPSGAQLAVSELEGDAAEAYYNEALKAVENDGNNGENAGNNKKTTLKYAKALDISILKDGVEVQPIVPISVNITLLDAPEVDEKTTVNVVHMGGENGDEAEVVSSNIQGESVGFEADAFSVYVVTYTLQTFYMDAEGNAFNVEVMYGREAGIPEGAELRVSELNGDEADAYAAQAAKALDVDADSLGYVKALDISIFANGQRVQPDIPISVSVRLLDAPDEIDEDSINVVHFGDKPEALDCALNGDTVEFETDGFSVYVITADTPRLGFTFNVENNAGTYTPYPIHLSSEQSVTKQIVKKGEKPIIPQLSSDEDRVFAGWYTRTSNEETGETVWELYDFDNIQFPTASKYDEVELFAVFRKYATVVFYGQYDGTTKTYPVFYTKRVELPEQAGDETPKVSERIDDVRATYSNDSDDGSMAFYGWSRTEVVAGQGKEQKIEDSTIEVSANTVLYSIFLPIHWLSFSSGPVGSGATYFPPTRYFVDEGTEKLDVPVRSGYSFEGWYTAEDGGVQVTNATGEVVSFSGAEGLSYNSQNGRLIPTADTTLYAHWTDDTSTTASYRIVIWRQKTTDADGLDDKSKTYDFVESVEKTATVDTIVSVDEEYKNYAVTKPEVFGGYSCRLDNNDASVSADGSTVLNVWYDRDSAYSPTGQAHTLTFVIPGSQNVVYDSVAYRTVLLTGNEGGSFVPDAPKKDHYTFSGWFADEACTAQVFFSERELAIAKEDANNHNQKVLCDEMPDNDLTIYAGWEPEWYLVQIDPNYGSLNGSGSTWFWTTYDGDRIQEYTQVTRDYVESNAGTWYYVKHDRAYYGYPDEWVSGESGERKVYYTQAPGEATEDRTFEYAPGVYSYVGWYEVHPDGSETPYVFGNPVDHNTRLKLHWKKAGTYYLAYSAGEGTLDGADAEQENNKELILPEGFADNSQIVLDRAASRPDYAFAGWSVRGDQSGRVYALGDTLTLRAEDATRINGKEIVYLDAVYAQAETAQIVYDANGGSITGRLEDGTLDLGDPMDSDASISPVKEVSSDNKSATISNLVNNSKIGLSDGTGFTKEGADFLGWCTKAVYDPNDAEAVFYAKDSADEYAVDIYEPMTLYAVWGVKVTYHLNSDSASWGVAWDSTVYTLDNTTNTYFQTAYLNVPVLEPTSHPTDSGKLFFGWKTEADGTTAYDFSQPVTGALDLYAFWRDPIEVPVHVVDASAQALVDKTETGESGWTANPIPVGTAPVALPGNGVASAPSDYEYAFVAAHDNDSLQTISEDHAVTAIYFNEDARHLYVTYSGGGEAVLNENEELYYVYYRKKALPVAYRSMDNRGVLNPQTVTEEAVNTTTAIGEYDVSSQFTQPLDWVSGDTTYGYYAFAVGDADAGNASQLYVITDTATASSANPPTLKLRNTWRGLEYSQDDGSTWQNCGYEPTLYVIYFTEQPTIILIDEKTVGPNRVMNTSFDYHIEVTQPGSGGGDPVTVYDSDTSDHVYRLKNGEEQSAVVFHDGTAGQTITVTQKDTEASAPFTTTGGNTDNPKVWTWTATAAGGKQTAIFTNTLAKVTVEAHVALIENSQVVERDNNRSADAQDYSFELELGQEAQFADKLLPVTPETSQDGRKGVFKGDPGEYAFGTILYGHKESGDINTIYIGNLDIVSVVYKQPEGAADNIRDLVLTDSNGNSYALGDSDIYYLYYPKPVIQYVKLVDNNTLRNITGSEDGSTTRTDPTYDQKDLVMNGQKVKQGQRIEVTMSGFRITQEAGANHFRMPPILDDGVLACYLSYEMIGVGQPNKTSIGDLTTNPDKNAYIRVSDSKLEWSFDGDTWTVFEGTPTIYAIYAERGYDLQINKTVNVEGISEDMRPIFTGQSFTLTISSPAITKASYDIEGTDSETIPATPAGDETPGIITLSVKDGARVRIQGLGFGTYQIVEGGKENYTLSATQGPLIGGEGDDEAIPQTDPIELELNRETRLNLVNTPKPLCRIVDDDDVEHIFFTLQSAVEYAYEHTQTATVEMLADYLMTDSDDPVIPNGLIITLTTAEDKYVPTLNTSGNGRALIVRSARRTDNPLLSNNGRLTLENITLDGGAEVEANAALIESRGNALTVGEGATLKNAKNSKKSEDSGDSGNGGAIFATSGDVTVSGSIAGCGAENGGAIYYTGNGAVTLSGDANISDNIAVNGGAIYSTGGGIELSGNAALSGNTAENGNGGAIHYTATGTISVSDNAKLSGNAAVNAANDNEGATGNGGAIYAAAGTIAVSGSARISGNTVAGKGGAIFSGAGVVNVSGGTIGGSADGEANTAANGAAIYVGSGSAAISGGSITGNTAVKAENDADGATGNGGAIYVDSGTVTVSGGSITGSKAGGEEANGSGGAIYDNTGVVNVSGGTIGGSVETDANKAANGAAVYVNTGSASFSGGSVTGNTATAGGAVGVGSDTARLSFVGNTSITGNTMNGVSGQVNVYLDQDTDAVISTDNNLTSSAYVGIYVPDRYDEEGHEYLFKNRGDIGGQFAGYMGDTVTLDAFHNDRQGALKAVADTATNRIYWSYAVQVEIRYLQNYKNGLPNGTNGDKKYGPAYFYPTSGDIAFSVIAEKLRGSCSNLSKTAVYATTLLSGDSDYAHYLTKLIWDRENGGWTLTKRDGTTEQLPNRKTVIYYSEPTYISIENNTEYSLDISNLTVNLSGVNRSVMNSSTDVGFGFVFALNGMLQEKLLPVEKDGEGKFVLARDGSINILIPGGVNTPFGFEGTLISTPDSGTVRVRRTGEGETFVSLQAPETSYSFTARTSSSTGSTYEVIFGNDKKICRIKTQEIPGVTDDEIAGKSAVGSDGKVEYLFARMMDAVHFAQNHDITEPVIEMLVDYLMPDSDAVEITEEQVFTSVTFTTATEGTYKYDGDRAIISRHSSNTTKSLIGVVGGMDIDLKLSVHDLDFDGKSVGGKIDGGAIKTRDCQVEVENVRFANCISYNGGAIFASFGDEQLNGSDVNKSPFKYVFDGYDGSSYKNMAVKIQNATFVNCESQSPRNRGGGGGVWANAQKLELSNCVFTDCRGGDQGGAIFHRIESQTKDGYVPYPYCRQSSTVLTDCTFQNCTAKAAGGVETDAQNVQLTGCTFTRCTASARGGGGLNIYIHDSADSGEPSSLTMTDCEFNGCIAKRDGGGLCTGAKENHIYLSRFYNTKANGNVSDNRGGGIYFKNKNGTIAEVSGCTFSGCITSGKNPDGGAVACNAKNLTVNSYTDPDTGKTTPTTIQNCTAAGNGGGIWHVKDSADSETKISDTKIDNCTAINGGGFYTYINGATLKTVFFTDSTIQNCTATSGRGGGIYHNVSGALTLENTNVTGNKVTNTTGQGGGIYCKKYLVMQNSRVQDNRLEANGAEAGNAAGVYISDNAGKLTVGNSENTTDNSAISGNATKSGATSNLRLPEKNNGTENTSS